MGLSASRTAFHGLVSCPFHTAVIQPRYDGYLPPELGVKAARRALCRRGPRPAQLGLEDSGQRGSAAFLSPSLIPSPASLLPAAPAPP